MADIQDLGQTASERAATSGAAVKAVLEYAHAGGDANPSAVRPDSATIYDFRAYVRHMMLWFMLSLMLLTGVRPTQTLNALLVAAFGASADNEQVHEGRFLGGLSFGPLLGWPAHVLAAWAEILPKLCQKDAEAHESRRWDPPGLMGQSAHGAYKNNQKSNGMVCN